MSLDNASTAQSEPRSVSGERPSGPQGHFCSSCLGPLLRVPRRSGPAQPEPRALPRPLATSSWPPSRQFAVTGSTQRALSSVHYRAPSAEGQAISLTFVSPFIAPTELRSSRGECPPGSQCLLCTSYLGPLLQVPRRSAPARLEPCALPRPAAASSGSPSLKYVVAGNSELLSRTPLVTIGAFSARPIPSPTGLRHQQADPLLSFWLRRPPSISSSALAPWERTPRVPSCYMCCGASQPYVGIQWGLRFTTLVLFWRWSQDR
ncbi:hypothetical protein NDU88_003999 [Pleurodeles waltl]|uniref:Uncharacterized protein n=1 Tax=Pleurodeles waltl TaxID=8319 RepID=A0AAV7UE39_PLEWA|nr:hypothetical protein NDU88_003999 [Pleurodeles waltl]